MSSTALVSISVGIVVERHKATSQWLDYIWRPASVLEGAPSALPWTPLGRTGDADTFYAGSAVIELHRTEAANYLGNLDTGAPALWVVLRPTGVEPPYELFTVTADPAEGEAFTEAGNDLVESVPMPASIIAALEAFVAEHYIERPFYKRQRNTADPDALARRRRGSENEE